MRVGAVDFIHHSAVTNSMHLQSAHTLNLQYFQSEAHLECSQTSAVDLFYRNSYCIFDKMFGRIPNVTLLNNLL